MHLLASSPLYIGAGGRFREPTELGAEYAYWAFTNVVPLDETEPSEPNTGGRYGRGLPVPMVAKPSVDFVFCSPFLHPNSD